MPSLIFTLSALSALALLSFVSAAPAPRGKQTFTIYERVAKPFIPGTVHLRNTYKKYGVDCPLEIEAAAGSVPATPEEYDVRYLCPVTIGGQTLNLDFDTGSSDL